MPTGHLRRAVLLLHHRPRSPGHSPFNVTRHPTSSWIVQQLREAFPYESAPRLLLLDHDAKYGLKVPDVIRSMNITAVRTAIRGPWQNGVAERWVGSCRRDLLDPVIAINEQHLKRLMVSYVSDHHEDRTYCGLQKQTPTGRVRRSPEVCITATTRCLSS